MSRPHSDNIRVPTVPSEVPVKSASRQCRVRCRSHVPTLVPVLVPVQSAGRWCRMPVPHIGTHRHFQSKAAILTTLLRSQGSVDVRYKLAKNLDTWGDRQKAMMRRSPGMTIVLVLVDH